MESENYYNKIVNAMKDYKTKMHEYGFDDYDRWSLNTDKVTKINDEMIKKYLDDTPVEFDLKTTEDTKPVKNAIKQAIEPSIVDEVKSLRAEVAQLRAVVSALTAIVEENC